MPRVVLSKALEEKRERQDMLLGTLEKYRKVRGYASWGEAAPKCGFAPSTLYTRLKKPDKLTLGEIEMIIRGLKIPAEEIRPYLC